MAGKLWIISTLVVIGAAWVLGAPGDHEIEDTHLGHHHKHHDHHDHGWGWHYPKYKFSYGVKDGKTWDKKTAAEWRDGKTVKGHYALQEPDGGWRVVNYIADEKGFRAQVTRTHNLHPGGHHHG